MLNISKYVYFYLKINIPKSELLDFPDDVYLSDEETTQQTNAFANPELFIC